MAWWDSQHQSPSASPRSRPRLVMGDSFPRLEPTTSHIDKHIEMERERALLSPVFEEQLAGPPTTPALVVHVDIRFTDPVIRSRYCRSYGSSPEFEATNRICRGLVRRIERCSEEFITRKDSGALEVFKGDTYERKPQRYEMTFRVMRRGKGEWAERTYRSYQKQPLTVAATKEVILAAHRIIGLFLRRHDQGFQWLDCPTPEADSEGSETTVPTRDGPLSLLSVPRSRFIEATQTFEFVPGYSIELCFRSRNPQRRVPIFERRIKVNSTQTTPLTLFMSEDMLWKALQSVNHGLDAKKREFDEHLRDQGVLDHAHSDDVTLDIGLRVLNHLGPVYNHVQRNIKSRLALFRDTEAKDCESFLYDIERRLAQTRNEADSILNAANDLEYRIVELKGVGWTLREPAKFTLGPSASYGRRTIQAALDRIQTGIGDVIRGHNIAIHLTAHKRGHLVLDKAIVAHEKREQPKETFPSNEDAQAAFVARLKARIQKDLDKVFEDSCSIDDIPEDEEDYFARPMTPVTPVQPEQAVFDGPSPRFSPSSVRSSPLKQSRPPLGALQSSPRPRAQRVFSLSRRSTESVRSIDYLKAARESFAESISRPSTAASEQLLESPRLQSPVPELRGPLLAAAELQPRRSFSLTSRRPSSTLRVSNASMLVEEEAVSGADADGQNEMKIEDAQQSSAESHGLGVMTSTEREPSPAAVAPGSALEAPPSVSLAPRAEVEQAEFPSRNEDNRETLPAAFESKQQKMDTPTAYVDAREYVVSPLPQEQQEIEKAKLARALSRALSPREDDEFSTAPSTPELSTGTSSPRQSVLITPVYLRTNSGAKEDPVLSNFYPEPEPDTGAIAVYGSSESNAPQGPRDKDDDVGDRNRDHLATDSPPSGQPAADSLPPSRLTVDAPEVTPGDAHSQCASEDTPDPATRAVARDEIPEAVTVTAKPAATPRTPATPSPVPLECEPVSSQTSQVDFGAERALASEKQEDEEEGNSRRAPASPASPASPAQPDFPTPQVRTSDDDNTTEPLTAQQGPILDGAVDAPAVSAALISPVTVSCELGCPLEPEAEAEAEAETEVPGPGAETQAVVEDKTGSDAPDDVVGLVDGAEAEAVPEGEADVVAERDGLGTEDSRLDSGREELGEERVPSGGTGSEVQDTNSNVGAGEVDTGSGLVAENQGEGERAAEAVAPVDIGPAEKTESVLGGNADAGIPDETAEDGSAEGIGSGAGSEVVEFKPEEPSIDVADPADAGRATNETTFEPEEDSSGPDVVSEQAQEPVSDPDQQVDGQIPAPAEPEVDSSDPDAVPEQTPDFVRELEQQFAGLKVTVESEGDSSEPDVVSKQAQEPGSNPDQHVGGLLSTSVQPEGDVSGPDAVREQTPESVPDPEQQVDGLEVIVESEVDSSGPEAVLEEAQGSVMDSVHQVDGPVPVSIKSDVDSAGPEVVPEQQVDGPEVTVESERASSGAKAVPEQAPGSVSDLEHQVDDRELAVEPEVGSSDPEAVPEQALGPASDLDQQGDGQIPAPIDSGAEESATPPAEDRHAADGHESRNGDAEDADAVGAVQDIVPELQAEAPEADVVTSPSAEEEEVTVPTPPGATEIDTPAHEAAGPVNEDLDVAATVVSPDEPKATQPATAEPEQDAPSRREQHAVSEIGQDALAVPGEPEVTETDTPAHEAAGRVNEDSDAAATVESPVGMTTPDFADVEAERDATAEPEQDAAVEPEQDAHAVPAGLETVETEPLESAVKLDVDDAVQTAEEADATSTGVDVPEAAKEPLPVDMLPDVTETEIPGLGVVERQKDNLATASIPSGDAVNGDNAGTEHDDSVEQDAAPEIDKGDVADGLPTSVVEAPAREREAPAPESELEESVETEGRSRGLAEDAATVEMPGRDSDADQKAPQVIVQTDAIGEEKTYESDKEESRFDAEAGDDDGAAARILGTETGMDEPGATPDEESHKLEINQDVGTEPGTPEPPSADKHAPPRAPVEELPGPDHDVSPTPAQTAKADRSADITTSHTAVGSAEPVPQTAPSPPALPDTTVPQLAPIPDLSKLPNLLPVPSQRRFSVDSILTIPRNSVDTIRPSTDEHQPPAIPIPELQCPVASSTSRPQTAGYLGLRESRFVQIGLRGALGDVKSRRMSLPLQHLLVDKDQEGLDSGRPLAPVSEAGGRIKGGRSRSKSRRAKVDEERDDGHSALPRMMMLFAGAVAIGKIVRRAAAE